MFDSNTVENSPVGIQIGPNVGGVVLSRNVFRDVARAVWVAKTADVLTLPTSQEGVKLFADGTLKGWVEEQHDFFQKKHPGVKTWSVKDGVVGVRWVVRELWVPALREETGRFHAAAGVPHAEGCNSGVCIRVPEAYDGTAKTLASGNGYEVQILDDAGQAPSTTSSGALYNLVAPRENAAPAGRGMERTGDRLSRPENPGDAERAAWCRTWIRPGSQRSRIARGRGICCCKTTAAGPNSATSG